MRVLAIKEDTEWSALGELVISARASRGTSQSALEKLRKLNPHLGASTIAAGTVVLVPDGPAFKVGASTPLAGDAIDEMRRLATEALEIAIKQAAQIAAERSEDRDAVSAALRTAAVKRAIDADAELRDQVTAAVAATAAERKEDEDMAGALAESVKRALAELDVLRKMLG